MRIVGGFLVPAALLLLASIMSAEAQENPLGGRPKEGGRGPIVSGPMAGGTTDVTGSNDAHLRDVSEFVMSHLESENSGLHFVQYKAEVQVVAGLMYTLRYKGNDSSGTCQEEHTVVVHDKPWLNERVIKSDTKQPCT